MVVTKILNHFSFHRSSMVGTHLPDDGSMHLPNSDHSSTNSNVRIMALSMARGYDRDTILTRKLCEDRRGFFDHLRPSVFAKNVSSWSTSEYNILFSSYLVILHKRNLFLLSVYLCRHFALLLRNQQQSLRIILMINLKMKLIAEKKY